MVAKARSFEVYLERTLNETPYDVEDISSWFLETFAERFLEIYDCTLPEREQSEEWFMLKLMVDQQLDDPAIEDHWQTHFYIKQIETIIKYWDLIRTLKIANNNQIYVREEE